MYEKDPRGGAGRGQGRKPLGEQAKSIVVSIRLTVAQHAKFQKLGGLAWVRRAIDKAKEPEPK